MQTKKTISDAQLKNEYIKIFESDNTDNTNIYEQIRTKYKLAKERHVKIYHKTLLEWANTKDKANNDIIYQNQEESLKKGLKLKIERQLELQRMLDDNYRHEVAELNNQGKVIKYYRVLEPKEKIAIHQELSKMAGDYSANKNEVSILNPIDTIFKINKDGK
jgi:hypothetical protein